MTPPAHCSNSPLRNTEILQIFYTHAIRFSAKYFSSNYSFSVEGWSQAATCWLLLLFKYEQASFKICENGPGPQSFLLSSIMQIFLISGCMTELSNKEEVVQNSQGYHNRLLLVPAAFKPSKLSRSMGQMRLHMILMKSGIAEKRLCG